MTEQGYAHLKEVDGEPLCGAEGGDHEGHEPNSWNGESHCGCGAKFCPECVRIGLGSLRVVELHD